VVLSDTLTEVLLIQRGTPPAAGRWSVPGGLVERGETLRQACRRELREETGLEAELQGAVKVIERIIGPPARVAYHYLIVDFWGLAQPHRPVAGSDVRDARWVPVDRVADLPSTHGLADVVGRALALARGDPPPSPLFDEGPHGE
jgi:ADP-ribose pyrophosphatase YjhB (NUDIX family)